MNIQEILIAAGAIENAAIEQDDTAWVVKGDYKMCFGECRTSAEGQPLYPPQGWDATEYERQLDDEGEWWREGEYTYAETDAEMVELARKYAP